MNSQPYDPAEVRIYPVAKWITSTVGAMQPAAYDLLLSREIVMLAVAERRLWVNTFSETVDAETDHTITCLNQLVQAGYVTSEAGKSARGYEFFDLAATSKLIDLLRVYKLEAHERRVRFENNRAD